MRNYKKMIHPYLNPPQFQNTRLIKAFFQAWDTDRWVTLGDFIRYFEILELKGESVGLFNWKVI